MPQTVLIHLMNEDPIVAEVEQIPEPTDQYVLIENPRRRDGTDLNYVLPELRGLMLPWHRIHCIEVLPSEEEERTITFVRE